MDLAALGFRQLILLRLVIAVAAAGFGSVVAVSFKKISHRGLCLLISFAAGALLAVALFDIFPEAVHQAGLVGAVISFATGYLLFYLITKFVFHICPACAATHTEANFKALTWAMIAALSVHSFMDGLAIYSGCMSASHIGLLVLLAVAYHKVPEGMALTLVALGSGMSRPRAFIITFGIEALTTLAGGLAGLASLFPQSARWIGYLLGHVGGGFVFLVIHALLSEVIKHHPRSTILAALVGALSMVLAGFVMAQAHLS